jgi:hypothetical protein
MFSSLGPQLVAAKLPCPRCGGHVELASSDVADRHDGDAEPVRTP